MVATSFCLIFPKAHLTPKASKEVAFSYDHSEPDWSIKKAEPKLRMVFER
jgi:hypothetical protein